MACILKASTERAKGIVVFTTQERDKLILPNQKLQDKILHLKSRWVIGLHHNWHDYQFVYNPLFDFSMAGEGDLKEIDGKEFFLIPMDACNFVPEYFRPSRGEKYWDILYIARAVYFKKIPEFFSCIKELYKQKKYYKVLFICSIPPYDKKEEKTVLYDVKQLYINLFNEEEKKHFTFLGLDYGYPFPINRETLAFFYRCSKIFVHFAKDERRCRVAAYAWASGLPVIAMNPIGSLLTPFYKTPPFFYEAQNYNHFPSLIEKALDGIRDYSQVRKVTQVKKLFSEKYTIKILSKKISTYYKYHMLEENKNKLMFIDLDLRLGRHHGFGNNPNNISQSLLNFVLYLGRGKLHAFQNATTQKDPEKYIANIYR